MPAPAFANLTVDELQARREQLTVIDVRSPGEFAGQNHSLRIVSAAGSLVTRPALQVLTPAHHCLSVANGTKQNR